MDMPDNGEGEGLGTEPLLDPEDVVDVVDDTPQFEEVPDAIKPEFDPQYVEPFKGLLYVGALTKEFEWLGHTFVIRTLNTNELLQVALVVKDYTDTLGHGKAYASAMAAASIVTLDGEELPIPVAASADSAAWARQRFKFVTSQWYPFTIDKVYSEYLELEKTANEIIEQMGNSSG